MVALLCWGNLAARETATRKLPIDVVGLGLLIVVGGALQVMLDTGKNADWFESPRSSYWLCVAGRFGAFLLWELTRNIPSWTYRCFRGRNFTWGLWCSAWQRVFPCQYAADPALAADTAGLYATWAGLVSAPTGAVARAGDAAGGADDVALRCPLGRHVAFAAFGGVLFLRASLRPTPASWPSHCR